MINITGLHKTFELNSSENHNIYEDLNLSLTSGEFISIVGKSGSGKTTLLNLIAGLEEFQSGSISVNSYSLETMNLEEKTSYRGKNISFIFQQFNLINNLTVEENIDIIIDINKLERRYKTQDILNIIGLGHKAQSYPYNLSGGEQQRVAVARAFVGKTPILLADEPTGNLDSKNAHIITDLIQQLHKESGNTIIMITHDTQISKIADTIYHLENKQLAS